MGFAGGVLGTCDAMISEMPSGYKPLLYSLRLTAHLRGQIVHPRRWTLGYKPYSGDFNRSDSDTESIQFFSDRNGMQAATEY
jgi:hypothetical protein